MSDWTPRGFIRAARIHGWEPRPTDQGFVLDEMEGPIPVDESGIPLDIAVPLPSDFQVEMEAMAPAIRLELIAEMRYEFASLLARTGSEFPDVPFFSLPNIKAPLAEVEKALREYETGSRTRYAALSAILALDHAMTITGVRRARESANIAKRGLEPK
jgi:hypothetical protein